MVDVIWCTKGGMGLSEISLNLVGFVVSNALIKCGWREVGSCMVVGFKPESAAAKNPRSWKNGHLAYHLLIEGGWRIEHASKIQWGSGMTHRDWDAAAADLVGRRVEAVGVFGRLPEIAIGFSGNVHVSSYATHSNSPGWVFYGSDDKDRHALLSRDGEVRIWNCRDDGFV